MHSKRVYKIRDFFFGGNFFFFNLEQNQQGGIFEKIILISYHLLYHVPKKSLSVVQKPTFTSFSACKMFDSLVSYSGFSSFFISYAFSSTCLCPCTYCDDIAVPISIHIWGYRLPSSRYLISTDFIYIRFIISCMQLCHTSGMVC